MTKADAILFQRALRYLADGGLDTGLELKVEKGQRLTVLKWSFKHDEEAAN